MPETTALRNPDRCPSYPGALLADIIPEAGRSKTEIARLLGISRQQLYDVMSENKPISVNVAARLGKLFGNGPDIWLRMQAAHDAWQAAHEVDVSGIPTLGNANRTKSSNPPA